MASVAKTYQYVVGIDTHARAHHLAVIAAPTAEVVADRGFPATGKGMARALDWVGRRTGGDLDGVLVVIEGIGSYGAKIAARAAQRGYQVAEAGRIASDRRQGRGKTDAIDAELIATSVLATDVARLPQARAVAGPAAALGVLGSHRRQLAGDKTRTTNALIALLRTWDLGIETTTTLPKTKIRQVAAWRPRASEDVATATARTAAIAKARRILDLQAELEENKTQMATLVNQTPAGPELLAQHGVGVITAATILAIYSHHGRILSEAAFAAIAGTNPIPASSGNTHRHRLNRGGDRQLNAALHRIAIVRIRDDQATQDYIDRLTTNPHRPKTTKEATRILKRRIARSIYRLLNRTTAPSPTQSEQVPLAA